MSGSLVIYTDGSCRPNPGPGGWGAIVLRDGAELRRLSGGDDDSTNNRMELTAPARALASLDGPSKVTIHTDSQYVRNGITQWIKGWQRKGWQTAAKKPVKNKELWQALAAEMERHEVEWKWVKAHVGHKWNEAVDELAKSAIGQSERIVEAQQDDRVYVHIGLDVQDHIGGWCVIMSYRNRRKLFSGAFPGEDLAALSDHAVETAFAALRKPCLVVVRGCAAPNGCPRLGALVAQHSITWEAESQSDTLKASLEMATHAARLATA